MLFENLPKFEYPVTNTDTLLLDLALIRHVALSL